MYIKAFNKDFKCSGFQYEIGKEYIIDAEPILCRRGFHFCKSLNDTMNYYKNIFHARYCIVKPLGMVVEGENKLVTNHIYIDRELSFNELIELDKDGEWCCWFADCVKGADVKLLQKTVIEKDGTGQWCGWFAKYVKGADIQLLQQAVREKQQKNKE